ncbi:hypothetical protein R9X47_25065 [Wukongibacter baidiensis]|uniref:hypothetical protein n=1 Tax=Wukongibacter baidiensis TaxID=1723361 RepID=UPI003D7FEF5D
MMWRNKFILRAYEHSQVRKERDSDRRQRLTNKGFRPIESIVGLMLIGVISILILAMLPKVMQNRNLHNLLKLLYSGASILALLGVIAIPVGIYKFIKRKG